MPSYMNPPIIIPEKWNLFYDAGIFREFIGGLRAIFSIEMFDTDCVDTPPMGIGEYRHISISRQERYPEWDEMRDLIYDCGLFSDDKDVVMFLPIKKQYVNVHPNCFHFYQKI